jgi:hypothetical protein
VLAILEIFFFFLVCKLGLEATHDSIVLKLLDGFLVQVQVFVCCLLLNPH